MGLLKLKSSSPAHHLLFHFLVITLIFQHLSTLICLASPTEIVHSDILTVPNPGSEPPLAVNSIKTPSGGTVKCSCKTVYDDSEGNAEEVKDTLITDEIKSKSGNSIEIEIYKPDDESSQEQETVKNNKPTIVKNSFTLDEDDSLSKNFEERLFTSTEPTSFFSYLTQQFSGGGKSDFIEDGEDDMKDDSATINPDMHNHRLDEESATTSPVEALSESDENTDTVYKSFRSTELGSEPTAAIVTSGKGGDSSEGLSGSDHHDYLADFINGKKQEILYLGAITAGSFVGPRKRRRRALRGNVRSRGSDLPVHYVYPVGKNPAPEVVNKSEKQEDINKMVVFSKPAYVKGERVRSVGDVILKNEITKRMDEALSNAWQEYGPTGTNAPPAPLPPPVAHGYLAHASHIHFTQHPLTNLNNIERIFINPFQPMTSEWDKHVTIVPGPAPTRGSLEPGLFSNLLARYMDFEVNNSETADMMRRVLFGMFVGFLIIGWIALGVMVGFIPVKKWFAFGGAAEVGKSKGKDLVTREALAEITDKILLSLDANWLKRLEERVMSESDGVGGSGSGRKIQTQVFCCILPDEHTTGMVECQVAKKPPTKNRLSAFKCLSDLIYNFQFGPKEDAESEEQDNIVNFKSKANNDSE